MQNRSGLLVRLAACVAAAAWVGLVPAAARAYDFVDLATYTPSATHVVGHLCALYSGTDLSCASTNPYVDSSGLVGIGTESPVYPLDVSGTVRATRFMGDGSGLTGVVASTGDRIVSSTTSMVADGATGLISVTQSGVNTAYFHPQLGLVTVGVSSTGGISGTTGYFSGKVGINTTANLGYASLNVNGNVQASTYYAGELQYNNGLDGDIRWSSSSGLETAKIWGNTSQKYLVLSTSGTEAMRIVSTGFVGIGTSNPSSTLHVYNSNSPVLGSPTFVVDSNAFTSQDFRYRGSTKGRIRVDVTGNFVMSAYGGAFLFGNDNASDFDFNAGGGAKVAKITSTGQVFFGYAPSSLLAPSTTLHVSGTIRMADGGEACDANRKGAIKYASSEFYVCRNGTAWESLTSVANNATPDRLVSGTATAILNPDGTLATQNLTAWGAGITALQAGNISASQNVTVGATLTAATSIGIGTASPSAPLDVSGAIKISGDGTEGCTTTADEGKIRWNPTRKRFQLCVH